jgi:hypothetical protein
LETYRARDKTSVPSLFVEETTLSSVATYLASAPNGQIIGSVVNAFGPRTPREAFEYAIFLAKAPVFDVEIIENTLQGTRHETLVNMDKAVYKAAKGDGANTARILMNGAKEVDEGQATVRGRDGGERADPVGARTTGEKSLGKETLKSVDRRTTKAVANLNLNF